MRRWIFALVAVIAIVTLIPLVVGGWAVWRTGTAVARAIPELTRVPPPSSLSTAQARTTADLKQLPGGYHALSTSPPAGGYGSVDPVAALSWALSIAQAWESGARLERIDVSRLRPDGTVNVQDDGDAVLTFRFRSPSRASALRQQARLQAGADEATGFWVRVKSGAPQVFADVQRGGAVTGDDPPPPHPAAEPLTNLMTRPAVVALREGLPFLNGYLIHLRDEGWVWYFSSLANESKPRVRATDGAVWPYRTSRTSH